MSGRKITCKNCGKELEDELEKKELLHTSCIPIPEELERIEKLKKKINEISDPQYYHKDVPDPFMTYKIENGMVGELSVGVMGLPELPDEIADFRHLKILNAAGNFLRYLPSSFKRMNKLEVVDLSFNWFPEFPTEIKHMKKLQKLILNNTQTRSFFLPDDVFELISDLVELDLSYANIYHLSSSIGKLEHLKILYLQHNYLDKLPDSFGNLMSLEQLYLAYNRLSSLPDSFSQITNLKSLYLNNNLVSATDLAYGFPNLKNINLSIIR